MKINISNKFLEVAKNLFKCYRKSYRSEVPETINFYYPGGTTISIYCFSGIGAIKVEQMLSAPLKLTKGWYIFNFPRLTPRRKTHTLEINRKEEAILDEFILCTQAENPLAEKAKMLFAYQRIMQKGISVFRPNIYNSLAIFGMNDEELVTIKTVQEKEGSNFFEAWRPTESARYTIVLMGLDVQRVE